MLQVFGSWMDNMEKGQGGGRPGRALPMIEADSEEESESVREQAGASRAALRSRWEAPRWCGRVSLNRALLLSRSSIPRVSWAQATRPSSSRVVKRTQMRAPDDSKAERSSSRTLGRSRPTVLFRWDQALVERDGHLRRGGRGQLVARGRDGRVKVMVANDGVTPERGTPRDDLPADRPEQRRRFPRRV